MSDYTLIKSGKDAHNALRAGARKLAEPVISTYGPRSRNVAINRVYPSPEITHDGVTVAKEIRLQDPFEDMGAVLIRDAASKTNDLAGDGTTTATLLANTLLQKGFDLVDGGVIDGAYTPRVNPMIMRDELEKYSEMVITEIDRRALKIKDKKDYQSIATVSSGSAEIGQLVADAIEKVGDTGIVMVEEGSAFESSIEFQQGMEFDNGFLSSYFVTDPDRNICVYENGYVLLTDYTIADGMKLVGIITKIIEEDNKPILIIADDVVGAALKALVVTKLKMQANIVAVKAPEYGDRRKEMLQDLAVLTGGNVISHDLDNKLEDVEIKSLGRFRTLRVTESTTAISPENPDNDEISERVNAIKQQIDLETNEFKKSKLQARMTKLSGTVSIINIGGGSTTEIKDKKARTIDAVYATKGALAEGVVPGGGITLKNIAENLEMPEGFNKDVFNLVTETLTQPFITLLENAGLDPSKIEELISFLPDTVKSRGYDLISKRAGDLIKMGITDPVKVTKLAVRHAFSIVATALTTEHLVSDDYEADRAVQKVKVAQ